MRHRVPTQTKAASPSHRYTHAPTESLKQINGRRRQKCTQELTTEHMKRAWHAELQLGVAA